MPGPDRLYGALNWTFAALASAFAAGFAGSAALILFEVLPAALPVSLNGSADWLILPVLLLGALMVWALFCIACGIVGLYISLPFAVVGLICMAQAERRSRIFRARGWWCLVGLLLMPLAIMMLPVASPAILAVAGSGEGLGLINGAIIGVPAALAGALTGRWTCHILNDAGFVLDDEPGQATSRAS